VYAWGKERVAVHIKIGTSNEGFRSRAEDLAADGEIPGGSNTVKQLRRETLDRSIIREFGSFSRCRHTRCTECTKLIVLRHRPHLHMARQSTPSMFAHDARKLAESVKIHVAYRCMRRERGQQSPKQSSPIDCQEWSDTVQGIHVMTVPSGVGRPPGRMRILKRATTRSAFWPHPFDEFQLQHLFLHFSCRILHQSIEIRHFAGFAVNSAVIPRNPLPVSGKCTLIWSDHLICR
jgi:hypothetical protein